MLHNSAKGRNHLVRQRRSAFAGPAPKEVRIIYTQRHLHWLGSLVEADAAGPRQLVARICQEPHCWAAFQAPEAYYFSTHILGVLPSIVGSAPHHLSFS